ncbi:hypothetical protein BHAOGJBA_4482 [Methylobacterium hispanicum]|uniref:Uncharacterized protein n=2 Tax=Methylobacterium hispanicum TaxID=270350 RepID=A0AAV4ZRP7_9HYPH|nr:hypothetical protein BHAOGJBA_4482 [Methylobacterium hispanicum]
MHQAGDGSCSKLVKKGEKEEFQDYSIEDGVRMYGVYRLGHFRAEDWRIDKGCTLRSQHSDLTPLLAGIEKECRMSSNFKRFYSSSASLRGTDTWIPKKPWVPLKYNTLYAGKVEKKEDWSEVQVDIAGPYRGLDVTRITLFFGHSNGISGFKVGFWGTPKQVAKALGNGWSTKLAVVKKPESEGEDISYRLTPRGRETDMSCAFSN